MRSRWCSWTPRRTPPARPRRSGTPDPERRRAAFWLVFVALIGGGLTLAVWLLAGDPFSTAILFAITVVVITCPDALGLATPTAIMVGTGLGARRGVLFKNAVALETSARIQTIVMDKTGTLTRGEPEVTDLVVANGFAEVDLLRLVAAVEQESEHPLAAAIVRHAQRQGTSPAHAERFQNVAGLGAVAEVDGRRVMVGNRQLAETEHVDLREVAGQRDELSATGRTAVIAAVDGRAANEAAGMAASLACAMKILAIQKIWLT